MNDYTAKTARPRKSDSLIKALEDAIRHYDGYIASVEQQLIIVCRQRGDLKKYLEQTKRDSSTGGDDE